MAKEYIRDKIGDFELLATLQHHGDKTNLIDFTTDYLVALFFACEKESEKPGRVILLPKQSDDYTVKEAPKTIQRAEKQKSVFVQAQNEVVKLDLDKVVSIPAELKSPMLDYLQRYHDIKNKTFFNDLQGFLKFMELHRSTYIAFFEGVTCHERGDSAKTEDEKQKWYDDAITHYNEAVKLKTNFAEAYITRGVVYYKKGDFDTAIEDFNAAIYSDPEFADAYYSRGVAWLHLSAWENAQDDLTAAKDMGANIVALFHNVYKTVEDFEAKHKVKLPEDIKALLQGTESGDKIISKENKVGDEEKTPSTSIGVRKDLSERQRQCIKFWTVLRDYMKDSQLPFPFPSPSRYSVLAFRMRRADFSLQPYFRTRDKAIGITLYVRGENATALFHWLKEQKAAIENEFGERLEWEETPEDESNKIYLRKEETDPGDERNWPDQHEWLASRLELFYEVFLPRIQALDAADWIPPEDEDDA